MASSYFTDSELPPESPVYIERDADRRALIALRKRSYLSIPAPRQQGITSLIHRLARHPLLTSSIFAYLDMTGLDWTTEEQWYWSMYRNLSLVFPNLVTENWIDFPLDISGCNAFFTELASGARSLGRHLVVAFDRFGALWKPWAAEHLSLLRALYNARAVNPSLDYLSFVIAGPFVPEVISQEMVTSPFNIAEDIRLGDFSEEQVRLLTSHLGYWEERTERLAQSIWGWTGGQPYLTHLICRLLSELGHVPDKRDVDDVALHVCREDSKHVMPLIDRWGTDEQLTTYTKRIVTGERIRFLPSENQRQRTLSLLGVIKADHEGYCAIRNRIYERALYPEQMPALGPMMPEKSKQGLGVPAELVEQVRRQEVVLFCGAGISMSEDGIPSGTRLAQELAHRAGLTGMDSASLPEVAQAYELEMGHHSLIAYLVDRIAGASAMPLRSHRIIASLPFRHIISTNWDSLLEEALRQAGKPLVRVVRNQELPYVDEEKVILVKLHGSVDQMDTIVVTGDDYYDVFARLPEVANLVRGYFATKTILFLGYGLGDGDFRRLYHEVVRQLGGHNRRAYAVQMDPAQLSLKYWAQKNVQVVAADVVEFLEALRCALGMTS